MKIPVFRIVSPPWVMYTRSVLVLPQFGEGQGRIGRYDLSIFREKGVERPPRLFGPGRIALLFHQLARNLEQLGLQLAALAFPGRHIQLAQGVQIVQAGDLADQVVAFLAQILGGFPQIYPDPPP